jgi:MFS family permease
MTQSPSVAAGDGAQISQSSQLWTRAFILLCVNTILCYCCHQLLVVVLPLYVESMGGSPFFAGLIFATFSVISFILRPLLGHLTDRWSVRGTLLIGAGFLGAFGALFAIPSLWVAFIANSFRGIGWGAYNTASSVGVALVSPPARRAEASGYYSAAVTTSSAFAPAIALTLLNGSNDYFPVFATVGISGVLAAISVVLMPPMGSGTQTFREAMTPSPDGFSLSSFIDRPVLMASILLVTITVSGPVTFAFVPAHAKAIGVENIGLYFILSGATSIVARVLLGRLLDQKSRGFWLVCGYLVLLVAFAVFTQADRLELFLIAALLNAVGLSLAQPTLMAFAIDRAERTRMGRAMATYSMFYRVGEGIGAPMAGALIVAFGYPSMYTGCIVAVVAGIVLTVLNWTTLGKPTVARPG